ncbi:MAG: 2-oxo acid dehydrogenase subunit E2 [Burkholderiaceae bacterium]|nr:2-oxo acid dehydrogenase subunit E2 [Burkholderiaceae bacterium]
MGLYAIKMPDIGEGIAEVELVAWHVAPGDKVAEDQVLAEVMTDKASVEVPSPVAGTVVALGGEVGQVMAVGSELIRLEVEGAGNLAAGAAAPAGEAPRPAADAPAPRPSPRPAEAAPEPAREAAAVRAPAVSRLAACRQRARAAARAAGERPLASPAVRHRAWELGIALQFVPGSGPAGRITHADLDAFVAAGGRPAPAAAASGLQPRHDEQVLPVIGLRRRIAQKMQEAKRRIPHFSYVEEVDVTELEALRTQLNDRHGETRGRLTVLPLLVRAIVLAVRELPQVNARYDDDAGTVTRFGAVHLGIATQTDNGLVVPVLRHAEARDPWDAAAEIARLAQAARGGKATRDELGGSTITITSLGALGGIVTTPVINHPEVAIVGVNRIVERPVMRGGAVVGRMMMNLSSSFDHRVVDGMDAARFVQAVRARLEAPALMFVEPA